MRSKKAAYNIATSLFLQGIMIVYGFIVPKIIIGKFGSNVNGLISSITQFLAYITLLESGFGPVVKATLYKPIANNDNETIASILKSSEKFFRKIALIFLIYIGILCVLYPMLVNKNFEWIYTCSLIIIIGISTFAEYFFGMTYKLYLQANQKSYVISIIQITTYFFAILVIVILTRVNASIQLIKLGSGLIFVFRPIIQNIYVKRKCNIDFKVAKDNYIIKQKWDGLSQHIAAVIHGNTDITLLTIFSSFEEVSVYSVYYLVIKALKAAVNALTSGIDATFGDMIAKKEKNNLNIKFSIYEVLFNMIITTIFTASIILIVPFVAVFTKNVSDANYIRHSFGVLLVVSEYIWAIRAPYSSITLAAGHFKETRIGAWIECIVNIAISMILVKKFGIIGTTIGTIIAMMIRTIEFIYHTNKYILKRSQWQSIRKVLLIIVETIIIICIGNIVPLKENDSYLNWIINALIITLVAAITTIICNFVLYKKEFFGVIELVKNTFKKRFINN